MDKTTAFWKAQKPVIENMLLMPDAAEVDALERPEVMGYLPPIQGMSILDLGAGIGRFTGEFAKNAAQVTALDLVPQFIEENRKTHTSFSNITYLSSDIRHIDFPESHFDIIFASGVFMYLEDKELKQLAPKIFAWLKKGGYLFFRECCSPHSKTFEGPYSHQRTIRYYHELMDPLFTLIDSGSIQVFIDRFANPFRCYWLYRKDRIESLDKLV